MATPCWSPWPSCVEGATKQPRLRSGDRLFNFTAPPGRPPASACLPVCLKSVSLPHHCLCAACLTCQQFSFLCFLFANALFLLLSLLPRPGPGPLPCRAARPPCYAQSSMQVLCLRYAHAANATTLSPCTDILPDRTTPASCIPSSPPSDISVLLSPLPLDSSFTTACKRTDAARQPRVRASVRRFQRVSQPARPQLPPLQPSPLPPCHPRRPPLPRWQRMPSATRLGPNVAIWCMSAPLLLLFQPARKVRLGSPP